MGGEQSTMNNDNSIIKDTYNRYNWVQSFIKYNEDLLKYNNEEEDEEKNYCDLRPNMNLLFDDSILSLALIFQLHQILETHLFLINLKELDL